jgi:redox-sensitive bicupin YhaK (pirin superfamily)
MPERDGIRPSYEQKTFSDDEKKGTLRLIASPDTSDGSVKIHQDVRVYASVLSKGDKVEHKFQPDRYGWLHVAKGDVLLNGEKLVAGDGAAISKEDSVQIASGDAERSEVILFDLA